MRPRVAATRALLSLYPLGWRRRYGDEMAALVEDDPPSPRGLGTLVTGAVRAHARPGFWQADAAAPERVRLSVWAVFCCWIGLSVAGVAFQKETEHEPLFLVHHGVFGIARTAVIAGAVLGSVAIAVAGLPLLWQALRQARSSSAPLRVGLLVPGAGLLLFAVATRVVLGLEPAVDGSSPLRAALLALWLAAGLAFALSCALAPRVVLSRLDVRPRALRRATRATPVLVLAMVLVTAGLGAYCAALVRLDPPFAEHSGGPLWPSTGFVLIAGAVLAAACTALAAVGATRAVRAARA